MKLGLVSAILDWMSFEEMIDTISSPVSYTHLDVYKRQGVMRRSLRSWGCP